MYFNVKIMILASLVVLSCSYIESKSVPIEIPNSSLSQRSNTPEISKRRVKRGHGGLIPFRPLFVYRQQQKEQQAKWKLLEAQKLIKEQQYQTDNQLYTKPNPDRSSSLSKQIISPYQSDPTYYPSYYSAYQTYSSDRYPYDYVDFY